MKKHLLTTFLCLITILGAAQTISDFETQACTGRLLSSMAMICQEDLKMETYFYPILSIQNLTLGLVGPFLIRQTPSHQAS